MRQKIFLLFCLLASTANAEPDITIIAHGNNEYDNLTRKQIADIYMGRITSLPNGTIPLPLDYQGNSDVRARFYQSITGKNMSQINAYWARLSFTGQANPPRRLADKAAILQVIEKNQDALGYIDNFASETKVTPVMTLK
jgi:ABC-type phosphate transport system substrate-binding protein